eukprot:s1756_g23.t1
MHDHVQDGDNDSDDDGGDDDDGDDDDDEDDEDEDEDGPGEPSSTRGVRATLVWCQRFGAWFAQFLTLAFASQFCTMFAQFCSMFCRKPHLIWNCKKVDAKRHRHRCLRTLSQGPHVIRVTRCRQTVLGSWPKLLAACTTAPPGDSLAQSPRERASTAARTTPSYTALQDAMLRGWLMGQRHKWFIIPSLRAAWWILKCEIVYLHAGFREKRQEGDMMVDIESVFDNLDDYLTGGQARSGAATVALEPEERQREGPPAEEEPHGEPAVGDEPFGPEADIGEIAYQHSGRLNGVRRHEPDITMFPGEEGGEDEGRWRR